MAAKLAGGGGGSKFDLGQNSDMNVTPFVDVMLVLLIIFMVVAPLATVSIKPRPAAGQGAAAQRQHDKPPTFISIQDSGQIYVSFGPRTRSSPSSMNSPRRPTCRVLARRAPTPPTSGSSSAPTGTCATASSWMSSISCSEDGYYKIGLISERPRRRLIACPTISARSP